MKENFTLRTENSINESVLTFPHFYLLAATLKKWLKDNKEPYYIYVKGAKGIIISNKPEEILNYFQTDSIFLSAMLENNHTIIACSSKEELINKLKAKTIN